ncbi:hypothetical protein BLA39750_07731 [Burkholderia lata]|uniref:Uncharacterized protein n=1 Tax=Burkholderia lata (strain ATCC 17760 / DSM 23089 / LMG 22485 / NCIMB 9086 / R18194 / 383) TaxID=482957 RepID=A0A6P3C7N9_BURL3|nr:hypothetical protein [Burkholderia lata]VWD63516.1 hypothetical protein BLA39750_07731 [Burkholderia lata]
MGLDWNPLGKAKPAAEEEFYCRLGQLGTANDWMQPVPFTFAPIDNARQEEVRQRFFEIQISPYETLRPPRVGYDPEADNWIRSRYEGAPNKPPTIEEWVRSFHGYWVMALLPDSDGLPFYSNASLGGEWERWSFRAQFLRDCEDALGERLFDEAWLNHLPDQLADYGRRLMNCASSYAETHGVAHVLNMRAYPADNQELGPVEGGPAYKAHIIASAARWALFWSARGHGMHADY